VPPDVSWARYEALAAYIGALGTAVYWWLGDLLNAGEAIFGEEYAQVEAVLQRHPSTLNRWRWVCKKIPPSNRRPPPLSFRHHQLVAALPPAEQARWLDRAEAERLSAHELEALLRVPRGIEPAAGDLSAETAESAGTSASLLGGREVPGGGELVAAARTVVEQARSEGAFVRVPRAALDGLVAALRQEDE
jgi:hypothetical protein